MNDTANDAEAPILDGFVEQALLDVAGTRSTRVALSEKERIRAQAQLHMMLMIEPRMGDGAGLNPHASIYTLTDDGRKMVTEVERHRALEEQGLALAAWLPDREPWGLEPEDFNAAAIFKAVAAGDPERVYHADGRLMLRGPNPRWNLSRLIRACEVRIDQLVDRERWTQRTVRPVGYCFDRGRALIAFNAARVLLRADYFGIIQTAYGRDCTWVALYDEKGGRPEPVALRTDTATGTSAAYCAPYCHDRKLDGLAGLIR